MLTGAPFHMINVRANRPTPGLRPQHLTCVHAAAEICNAEVRGGEVGSSQVIFDPEEIQAGHYTFDTGTAGSTALVIQTLLLPLAFATAPSIVGVAGGTHNESAPSISYLDRVFIPACGRFGIDAKVTLERYGFYPKGGGRATLRVQPLDMVQPLDRTTIPPGAIHTHASVLIHDLLNDVDQRELGIIRKALAIKPTSEITIRPDQNMAPLNPANVCAIEIKMGDLFEQCTALGKRGRLAEFVAEEAVAQANAFLAANVPVGPHLADQLLLPLAIFGGAFTTMPLTGHSLTNIEVINRFLSPEGDTGVFEIEEIGDTVRVRAKPAVLPR